MKTARSNGGFAQHWGVSAQTVIGCRDEIHRLWVSYLRQRSSRDARDLTETISTQHREGTDLLSLWLQVLENGDASLSNACKPLIDKIHRLDYSIVDLHVEVVCLKDAVDQALRSAYGKEDDTSDMSLRPIFRSLDDLFGVCLEKTSLIYETAVEESARGYCHLGKDGGIQFANRAFHDLVGRQTVGGGLFASFFPGREEYIQDVISGSRGTKPSVHRMLLRQGSGNRDVHVLVELVPVVGDAAHKGACATITDITDIANAELANYERSKRGFLRTDTEFVITYANKKMEKLLGRRTDDLVGLKYDELFPGDENRKVLKKQRGMRTAGEGDTYKLIYQRPIDKHRIPLDVNAWPEFDTFGERVGHMGFFESRQIPDLARRIHEMVETKQNIDDMLTKVLELLQELVRFDFAIVGTFTETMSHWRSITVYPDLGDIWVTHWWQVPKVFLDWISKCGPHVIPQIEDWLNSLPKDPGLKETIEDPTLVRLIDEGYVAYLVLPVKGEGRVVATLTLASRTPGFFGKGQEHVRLLRKLPLAKAVHMALHLQHRAEADFFYDLIRRLGKSAAATDSAEDKLRQVASELVVGLTKFYGWQNVSIFKVDEEKQGFELLAQAESAKDGYRLEENHWQEIDRGILGEALRKGHAINLRDAREPGRLSEIYVPSNDKTRSELCLPVIIRGRAVWMLNLEDSRRGVFCEEDEHTLQRIVNELQSFLEELFTWTTLKKMMEESRNGIVVTGRDELLTQLKNRVNSLKTLSIIATRLEGAEYDQDALQTMFLTGMTARDGLGLSRAMLFLYDEDRETLVGTRSVGALSFDEARSTWEMCAATERELDRNNKNVLSWYLDEAQTMARGVNDGSLDEPPLSAALRNKAIILGEQGGALAECIRSRHTCIIPYTQPDELRNTMTQITNTAWNAHAFACVPLLGRRQNCLGALLVDNRFLKHEKDITFDTDSLESYAYALAMSIENSQLRRQVVQEEMLGTLDGIGFTLSHNLVKIRRDIEDLIDEIKEDIKLTVLFETKLRKELLDNLDQNSKGSLNILKPLRMLNKNVDRKKKVRVFDLVSSVTRRCAPDRHKQVHIKKCEQDVFVLADRNLLEEAIFCIVDNSLLEDQVSSIFINIDNGKKANADGKKYMVTIEIMDDGQGINSSDKDRIFDAAYTTRKRGFGLGLTIAKRFIELHEGTVTEQGIYGSGASFMISLPRFFAKG